MRLSSPASHLPLRRRAPLRFSRYPRCPGKLRLGPKTHNVHPLRSAVPGEVTVGPGTPTHHRDMAALSRAAERGARITALGTAAGDGGTGPGRAPAETFLFLVTGGGAAGAAAQVL